MKKLFLSLATALSLVAQAGTKDEGMWIPLLLNNNYAEMQRLGLKLTPEQLYSINNSSLKDAIVWFNRGCTGEVVSDKGLLFTNHHCGYSSINALSTTEHNYLKDGFWAKSTQEELPAQGLSVSFVVRIEDVSSKVKAGLEGVKDADRASKYTELAKKLTNEAVTGTHYKAELREMFKGAEYYLFVFETFTDIRLVGTPPENIGKFGGDTDNWMWPRHTGDFSVFRIYAGKDGKPAPYSPENVPYKPKHFLPISLKGYQPGSFSMIMGFPGATDRYLTESQVKLNVEETYPALVNYLGQQLETMKKYMDTDEAIRLKYAGTYANMANGWKKWLGMINGLNAMKYTETKAKEDKEFENWINSASVHQEKYGVLFQRVNKAVYEFKPYNGPRIYYSSLGRVSIYRLAAQFAKLEDSLFTPANDSARNKITEALTKQASAYQTGTHAPLEKELLAVTLELLATNVPADKQDEYLKSLLAKAKGATLAEKARNVANMLYDKSILTNAEKLNKFLAAPKAKVISKDPLVLFAKNVQTYAVQVLQPAIDKYSLSAQKDGMLYIEGLREQNPNKQFYPDANSSLRLSYGTTEGYRPKDAVVYDYITYLDGVMEKEDPTNPEFVVDAKLKEVYQKKDFGPYALPNGRMPVAFLTNHDITGGNSGSPVINGEGQLLGLAFDGNWESMAGDVAFDPRYKRTISVDIRYVLLVIDKVGGASNLINELTLVK